MLTSRLSFASLASSRFSPHRRPLPRHLASHSTRPPPTFHSASPSCRPNSTNHATAPSFLRRPIPRFCATNSLPSTKRPSFSFLEWRTSTLARLKAKKAQLLVEYGSTFVFLHESLGVASYLTCFAIASLGFITMEDIINFIGVIPDNVKEIIAVKEGSLTTKALTALVLLKCLDFLGLTPLRWAIAIALTPRIAWWVGPRIDASIAFLKASFTKRPPSQPPHHTQ